MTRRTQAAMANSGELAELRTEILAKLAAAWEEGRAVGWEEAKLDEGHYQIDPPMDLVNPYEVEGQS